MAGIVTVLWIAMAVAVVVIAKRKGWSGEKWLLAIVLFGPLAFLVLLFSDSVPPPTPRPKLRVEVEITLRLCPHCLTVIPSVEAACPSCAPALV